METPDGRCEMFRFVSNIQDCDDTREYAIFNSVYGSGNISSSVLISTQRTLVGRVREIAYLGIGLLNVTSQCRRISTTH
ncbi:hypothetical protein C0J52_17004 [Blattella germanica]|nr:hypothetical protein C0J52_17004 [Blattella germanica]